MKQIEVAAATVEDEHNKPYVRLVSVSNWRGAIDEVATYRQYGGDGNPVKGEYARIFEEEYGRAAKLPDYRTL